MERHMENLVEKNTATVLSVHPPSQFLEHLLFSPMSLLVMRIFHHNKQGERVFNKTWWYLKVCLKVG